MLKMGYINKRGISPLIATVLLVGLVVVLGVLFFLFAKGQITAQIEKQQCEGTDIIGIDFSAECVIEGGNTKLTITNLGSRTIDGIRIVGTSGGNAESPGPSNINVKPGDEFSVPYEKEYDEIEVIPLIMKETKDKTVGVLCVDKSTTALCLKDK